MQIAPGVYHFNTDPFNWYVLEESGRLTLVDAGFPGHFGTFHKGIRSIGKTLADVEAVILSHAHADHMGFADHVAKAANAPVFIHKNDVVAAQKVLQLPWLALLSNAWRPFMAGMLSKAILNRVFSPARVINPRPFVNGEVLNVPGRPQVIHLPGHTMGEVGFYLSDRKVLISGDAIVTRDLYTGKSGDPQLTRPRLNDDDNEARRSLQRLKGLGHVKILPGHGLSWEGDISEAISLALGK